MHRSDRTDAVAGKGVDEFVGQPAAAIDAWYGFVFGKYSAELAQRLNLQAAAFGSGR
jgi:hypothetical protein